MQYYGFISFCFPPLFFLDFVHLWVALCMKLSKFTYLLINPKNKFCHHSYLYVYPSIHIFYIYQSVGRCRRHELGHLRGGGAGQGRDLQGRQGQGPRREVLTKTDLPSLQGKKSHNIIHKSRLFVYRILRLSESLYVLRYRSS